MSNKNKVYIEEHKLAAQRNLTARTELLVSRGMDETRIQKDNTVKKIKAEIRLANHRLSRIADQQKLKQEKIEAKAAKATSSKQPREVAAGDAPKPKKEKKSKEKKQAAGD